MPPFIFISPATRGLGLALTRHYLRTSSLPIFATYRPHPPSTNGQQESTRTPEAVRAHVLEPLQNARVDPARLHLVPLDLTSETSIASAGDALARTLPHLPESHNGIDQSDVHGAGSPSHLHIAFLLGGLLYPERSPADLVLDHILETFRLNVISHLLLIKHFSRFLPPSPAPSNTPHVTNTPDHQPQESLAKWVHVSARVGSVSDNRLGGWYSYRASKAALNQVVRTFDLHLQAKKLPALAVGVHPGTVKTDLSRDFWKSVKPEKLFSPEYAAERLAGVVGGLRRDQRGKVWDWKGEEVKP